MSASCALRRIGSIGLLAVVGLAGPPGVGAQTVAPVLAWEAAGRFKYNIENVAVRDVGFGSYAVRVVFSVTDPASPLAAPWDVKAASPFQPPPGSAASLTLDIGWDPSSDFSNTGSENLTLAPVLTPTLGKAAAMVVQVRDLHRTGSQACTGASDCPGVADYTNRFWVEKIVSPIAFGRPAVTHGRVAIEGRPVCYGLDVCTGALDKANIPVTSATADFALAPADPQRALVTNPRRVVVDIAKCKGCHDGNRHGDHVVPRLSLHGGNRNENLDLCVMCHNANQTDVPYRSGAADPLIAGPETPVNFTTMVHSIHSGGFRKSPFVVIGRNSSINDFSDVRFPSKLRNCLNCHVESGGKGSYELPISANALGTTVRTYSNYTAPPSTRTVDVNPSNDDKVSPTAAACSACHDKGEVKSHMVRRGGASFATKQEALGTTVRERCANCHGPGKDKSVRKVHEVGRSESPEEHDDD